VKIYRSLSEAPPDFGPSALTIGNFDGVHYGHRRILRRVVALARERGWHPSVLTFDPHPTRIVAPARTPALLSSPIERVLQMEEEGIAQALILPFTTELALLSPEEFARRLLVDALGARAVLVGANFRFGHKQAGNVDVLAELGRRLGFQTEIVGEVHCRGRMVSSSGVRELIRAGNVSLAARFLTHPYSIQGDVVSGRGVGSKQTVPTLNLDSAAEVIPNVGVYITRTHDTSSGRQWQSITNIGYRPTFGDSTELSIETFLLEPLVGAAPDHIRVEFLRRVRDERKFETPAALRAQILHDVASAKSYFRRMAAWAGGARAGRTL
jgi:riboflavin kinase/FMN adenylyltransferase